MRVLFLWWTLEILLTDASVTHHVYWNSTNTLFDTFEGAIDSPGYYEISAPARDYIKFHCPKRKSREFSLVYQVSKESFERCTLLDGSELVGSCDGQHKAFTVPLKTLKSPMEETVYYISTSTGLIDGLQSQRFGLCLSKNMRLAVSLELHETLPLEGVLNGLELESKGLADGTLYLIEENNEILWKKNVHPSISKDLNEKLRKSYKFDKNKELAEPIPISYEFFTEKLEEMHSPEEQYIFPRPHPKAIKEDVVMSTGSLSPLLFVLVTLYILL